VNLLVETFKRVAAQSGQHGQDSLVESFVEVGSWSGASLTETLSVSQTPNELFQKQQFLSLLMNLSHRYMPPPVKIESKISPHTGAFIVF